MKALLPIILILVAVGLFFLQINPKYAEIKTLKAEGQQYDEALKMADELKVLRGELATKLESFSASDLERLDHFMPQRLDTVRTILDVDAIATRDSIRLKDLTITDSAPAKEGAGKTSSTQYNTTSFGFTFDATYSQAMRFLQDIQTSLRLLDPQSLAITPAGDNSGLYKFTMKLNTYWVNR